MGMTYNYRSTRFFSHNRSKVFKKKNPKKYKFYVIFQIFYSEYIAPLITRKRYQRTLSNSCYNRLSTCRNLINRYWCFLATTDEGFIETIGATCFGAYNHVQLYTDNWQHYTCVGYMIVWFQKAPYFQFISLVGYWILILNGTIGYVQ